MHKETTRTTASTVTLQRQEIIIDLPIGFPINNIISLKQPRTQSEAENSHGPHMAAKSMVPGDGPGLSKKTQLKRLCGKPQQLRSKGFQGERNRCDSKGNL